MTPHDKISSRWLKRSRAVCHNVFSCKFTTIKCINPWLCTWFILCISIVSSTMPICRTSLFRRTKIFFRSIFQPHDGSVALLKSIFGIKFGRPGTRRSRQRDERMQWMQQMHGSGVLLNWNTTLILQLVSSLPQYRTVSWNPQCRCIAANVQNVHKSPESSVFSPLFPALYKKTHSAASLNWPNWFFFFLFTVVRGKQPCQEVASESEKNPWPRGSERSQIKKKKKQTRKLDIKNFPLCSRF